jgi:hypothetical protein
VFWILALLSIIGTGAVLRLAPDDRLP